MLQQKDGKQWYLQAVSDLSKAFALAVPHDSALEIRDEVGFFQKVRAVLAKSISEGGGKSPEELELAVRQIVSRAISSDKLLGKVKHSASTPHPGPLPNRGGEGAFAPD